MEYLQYKKLKLMEVLLKRSFKPYYKWNTFNTMKKEQMKELKNKASFKPYYKWNTFNTFHI